jgi:oligopeptide/dipeptide ABC transporter ATP-binding protein
VSALDVSIRSQVLNLLHDLQQRLGLAYLFISHDLAVVKHVSDRIAVMNFGHIVEVAPAETLFADPRHPYTRALLSAIPVPKPRAKRERIILQGDMPSALHPPAACRFHTRCPYAIERCSIERPPLIDDGGHATACHRWRELAPAAVVVPNERSEALDKLVSMFARGTDVQSPNGVGTVDASGTVGAAGPR